MISLIELRPYLLSHLSFASDINTDLRYLSISGDSYRWVSDSARILMLRDWFIITQTLQLNKR